MSDIKLDCTELKIKIENLTNLISSYSILAVDNNAYASQINNWKKILEGLKLDYNTNGCIVNYEAIRQEELKEVADKYKDLDKSRIEEISTYDISKRVFYGVLVLMSALGIMIIVKKK
jgi:hypothetical protein